MFFKIKKNYIFIIALAFINKTTALTPQESLDRLIKGNKEYIKKPSCHIITKEDRKKVATVQEPFAIVLSCSDSRVPPELIFNQVGLGNLFVIRNAGNLIDDIVLGSIEYAIEHLESSLLVVLGHERCGAVTAAVDAKIAAADKTQKKPKAKAPEKKEKTYITKIIDGISPALKNIKIPKDLTDDAKAKLVTESVKANVKNVVSQLQKKSSIIAKAIKEKKLKIVGGYYDLDDGDVKLL